MKSALSPGKLAQVACILEATARKPGNVHRFLDFDDLDYLDFVLSAAAVADPLDRARSEGVGAAVLAAVEATRRVVATNSNLGMILLLAPLAAVSPEESLRDGVGRVLAATTIDDARSVYQAIRLANPGGLGQAAEQDVADEPTITLREAMTLAADRDLIARQYAEDFAQVLDEGLPALRRRLRDGQPLEIAIIGAFLDLLSRHPDSLIARKLGWERAVEASRRAGEVLAAGWPDESAGRGLLRDFDAALRSDGRRLNPGATADLMAAVLFAALRDGTIELPRPAGPSGWSGDRRVIE
jgi:triphosphoribosyl-dephospho-CoA synthase